MVDINIDLDKKANWNFNGTWTLKPTLIDKFKKTPKIHSGFKTRFSRSCEKYNKESY